MEEDSPYFHVSDASHLIARVILFRQALNSSHSSDLIGRKMHQTKDLDDVASATSFSLNQRLSLHFS
jgi:hypothetical protein